MVIGIELDITSSFLLSAISSSIRDAVPVKTNENVRLNIEISLCH